jgi:hypothetical protein
MLFSLGKQFQQKCEAVLRPELRKKRQSVSAIRRKADLL